METMIIGADAMAEIVRRFGRDRIMDWMIERLTAAFERASRDGFELPPRQGFHYDKPHTGLLEWMPVLEPGREATLKMVSYTPGNPARHHLPTVVATVSLYDVETGRLLALTDGVLLTALRTGAASAVASRILARPDSRVAGLIGCGMQAVTQLHALCRVLPIERALVHDRHPEVEASFPRRAAFLGIPIEAAPIERVELLADILCTATSVGVGEGPVVGGRRLAPHVHINAVGSDFPGKVEIPVSLLRRSLVVPDFLAQAIHEGECQQLEEDEIGPDLGTLVADPESFTEHRARTTVFDSTGSALEDHTAVQLFVELAREIGVGQPLRIEHLPRDFYDPYDIGESEAAWAARDGADPVMAAAPAGSVAVARGAR